MIFFSANVDFPVTSLNIRNLCKEPYKVEYMAVFHFKFKMILTPKVLIILNRISTVYNRFVATFYSEKLALKKQV